MKIHNCLEIYRILWESIKCFNIYKHHDLYENHENPSSTMKVFRGREASLESSRGLYSGNQSQLEGGARFCQGLKIHAMDVLEVWENRSKIDENPKAKQWMSRNTWTFKKSMHIHQVRWKSSVDKKPAWNRAKVPWRATSRILTIVRRPCHEIYEYPEQFNFTKIWKSMTSMKSM